MTLDPELMLPLRAVIDPELGVNIVDLGLIYEARREGPNAFVRMTMTTPACPMGPYFEEQVTGVLTNMVRGVEDVEIDFVYEPRWTPSQMTDEARTLLGIGD